MKKLLLLILFYFSLKTSYCQYSLPDDIMTYTALVEFSNGSSGSGFFYIDTTKNNIYFVTAKHVLLDDTRDPKTGKILYALKDSIVNISFYPRNPDTNPRNTLSINLQNSFNAGNLAFNIDKDIAVLKLGTYTKQAGFGLIQYNEFVSKKTNNSKISEFFEANTSKFKDVNVSYDVFIFGYPKSLGLQNVKQYDFSRPLLRKGIVAGKDQSLKSIIIDCPSYGGNSGGPVVIMCDDGQCKLIGLVVEFIPLEEKWISPSYKIVNTDFSNSGYSVVVPIDFVLELIKTFK